MPAEQIEVKRAGAGTPAAGAWSYRPAADVIEGPDAYMVVADLPGAAQGTIDVRFEDGTLAIHAAAADRRPGSASPLFEEYGVGDFDRRFGVFDRVDPERVEATFADGVLTIRLPKAAAARRRTIAVKSA